MKPILNLLAILTASVAHFISGFGLVSLGRIHTLAYLETDMELPLISAATANYTASVAPIVSGAVLALMTLVGLTAISRSEKFKWLLPFLLTISFTILFLHIMFVFFGVTVPMLPGISTMSE